MSKNEFKPDWTLDQQEALCVQLSMSLCRHAKLWQGATDNELLAIAADIIRYFEDQISGYIAGNKEMAELVESLKASKEDWHKLATIRAQRIVELEDETAKLTAYIESRKILDHQLKQENEGLRLELNKYRYQ